MADIATLGVKVDSKGAETGSVRVNKSVGSMRKSFRGLKTLLVTVGLTAFFLKTIKDAKVFQQSIADLSAITGATGEDLKFLSDKAREFGATTTLTASQAAEAFKLIASAKPDLLESGEALAKVTKNAITLAEASGSTLPQAAMTLGSALNQFSADAEEASRFMNVLAAGAKFGASEIPETSEAMRLAGTVAASMGISFEQANASIQSLANIAIKGSEAGAALRNVFLRLESSADKNLRPSVVGLDKALDGLAAKNLSSAEMTKLFGLRAITAAQQLVRQRKEVSELTEKLTGTATAYEQAAIKVDTLEGDTKALNSAMESFSITLGDKSNPGMRDMTQLLTLAIRQFDEMAQAGGGTGRVMEGIEMILAFLVKTVNFVIIAFANMGDQLGAWAAQIGALASLDIDAFKSIRKEREATAKANEEVLKKLNAGIDNRKQIFKDMKDAQAQAIIDEQEWSKAVKELNDEVEGSERKLNAQRMLSIEAGREMTKLLSAIATPQEKYNEKVRELQLLLQQTGDQKGYLKLLAEAKRKLEEATGASSEFTSAERERLENSVKQLDRSLMTEEERILISNQRRNAMLEDAWLRDLITDETFEELKAKNREAAEERLTEIARAGALSREEFAKLSMQNQVKSVLGFLEDQTAGIASSNKTAFDINKAAAISQATIKTYEMATSAYSAMAGIPFIGPVLGVAAAGAAIALGLANIQQISSQQFQGYARGGFVPNIDPILVGEKGPEIFVPPSSGNIIPNDKLGGQEVNVTNIFNIKSDTGKVDMRSVQQIQTAVGQSINRALQRNS